MTCIGASQGMVLVKDFMSHVEALSELLPDAQHAINLCENRYLFLLSLCACALRGQTNLMPSNKNVSTQEALSKNYIDSYIIHDGTAEIAELDNLDIRSCDLTPADANMAPIGKSNAMIANIPLDHLAAICFTSGSTGETKPNPKTWRTLLESTAINSRYMLPNQTQTFYHLATVPGQHMWGFETSVLMALFAKVCMVDARPSFPQDICTILQNLPEPRTIIATPLHLRALATSPLRLGALARVLCATAPLSQELACEIEQKFDTTVCEVYGCSEVGSMAIRQPANSVRWRKFYGIDYKQLASGKVLASTNYLPEAVQLDDAIEMHDGKYFSLRGRVSDQIKIAGKRGSLHEVNRVLQSFDGLEDGMVFFPEQDHPIPRLVALVALREGVDKKQLRIHFQKYLDSAFVPRPILEVPQLPREESGKLKNSRLLELYKSCLSKN